MTSTLRTAFVTGGGSGIGRAVVLRLLDEGYAVTTCGRTLSKLEALQATCEGKPLHILQGDVSDEAFSKRVVQHVEKTYGRLDVLVNNAGVFVGEGGSVEETLATWKETLNINLIGVFGITQALYPLLQKGQNPAVINISSVCGLAASMRCGSLAYSASKAGLDMLTTGLAQAMGADGIRVNSINPGVVETPIWEGYGDAMQERAQARHVLKGQVVQPEDIAAGVSFLASPGARMITGALLPIDAGYGVS